ncbi:ribonuclease H-like domain-containing protein, partial [Tanacetum coccineum]
MLKTTGYSSKKDILSISNSFSALNDEEEDDEEDVQNVYDESANLFQNTKAGGSSSFTATVGNVHRKKKLLMASPDQQWYMDTGATSHLSSHTGNLQTSSLNPYRPLHLKNVPVTPNIIKNLVSVRKFTTDNKCSIDFDPYGFTVRDYHTRQTLLRCDNTGDLYPLHVAASAFALLTNNHSLWHQRLGHPGDNVIQTLSSRGLVSYNKQNTQHLCRACQLGKQTKLPFQRSTSIVTSPFDIIHSDLWTSPVSSMSGYKYYVLFLDHYSHFLWVYPLHRKSDAQSKL